MTADIIKFYSSSGTYGFLSNFSKYSLLVNDVNWSTAEHFYQACKTHNEKNKLRIQLAQSPKEAAHIGRHEIIMRSDWDTVKIDVMRLTLLYKF